MDENERIMNAIFSAIDEVNEQQPKGHRLEKTIDTLIMDKSGKLDSLALVNLIVATEQKIEETFGIPITLTDQRAFSQKSSPFKAVGTLCNYIALLLEENSNGR